MADALGMNIRKRTEELVDINLDLKDGHGGLHLVEESRRTVDSFRHKLQHQI